MAVYLAGCLAAGVLAGCGAATDAECPRDDLGEARPLVANDAWVPVPTAEDPFWAHSGEYAACGDEAMRVEDIDGSLWFDVTTETCNYLTVSQPALGCAGAGEDLTIWIFHYAITQGDGPYHMAVGIGDPPEVIWETERAVPTVAGLIFEAVTLDRAINAGDTLTWHVSNHGANTWSMIGLFAGAPGAVVPGSGAP